MTSILAIDFETANESRASACAVGFSAYKNGVQIDGGTHSTLLRPIDEYSFFSPHNVAIHGITADSVLDAPEYINIHEQVFKNLPESVIIAAHNASFDYSVLKKLCQHYDLKFPKNPWIDTLKTARRVLPQAANHRLSTVVASLGLGAFNHHNPIEDAIMAAKIALQADIGLDKYVPYSIRANSRVAQTYLDFDSITIPDEAKVRLSGEVVVFTGEVPGVVRVDAQNLVSLAGGIASKGGVTKKTTILVDSDANYVSLKEKKALEYISRGFDIQIITGDEFRFLFSLD